jgi:hypothetical protein
MCNEEFREETPNENEGEHTPPNAATHNAMHAGGAAMPPPVGQS